MYQYLLSMEINILSQYMAVHGVNGSIWTSMYWHILVRTGKYWYVLGTNVMAVLLDFKLPL
jgi:hypothetical protein